MGNAPEDPSGGRKEFKASDVEKMLLWSGRHCCICGKSCGVFIEIAHIDRTRNDIDNGIPACFECHGKIGHYNASHPRGRKHRPEELKARREQIYEEHTAHLVPPVDYRLKQSLGEHLRPTGDGGLELVIGKRQPGDVGFEIVNLGGAYPAQALVTVTLYQGGAELGHPETIGHYDGTKAWNLNPGLRVSGHFPLPRQCLGSSEDVRAKVEVTLVDVYGRRHRRLPVGWILPAPGSHDSEWYFEPSIAVVEGGSD